MNAGLRQLVRASRLYRRRRAASRFFSRFTVLATPGAVALLTVAFLARALWPPLIYALLLLPAWLLMVATYVVLSRRLWATPAWQADAVADLRSGSRGTFMAVEEARGEEWAGRLGDTAVALPVRLPWPELTRWLAAAALALAVLLSPDLRPRSVQAPPATTPLDRMEDLVATLRQEELAEEEYLDRVDEVLEEMRQEAETSLGAEDWQSLDGLREELARQLVDNERRLEQSADELSALRSAVEARGEPTEQQMEETAKALAQMDAEAAADLLAGAGLDMDAAALDALLANCRAGLSQLTDEQREMLRSLAGQCTLTPEQAARLAELLAQMDPAELAAMCEEMGLGKLSPEDIERLLKACKGGRCSFGAGDVEALCALLAACEGESLDKYAACLALLGQMGLQPGRGGVSRGPGPAALTGAGETGLDFGQFEDRTFGGNVGAPEVPMGFAFAPPDEAAPGEAGPGGLGAAAGFGAGDERITWHTRLLPRHNDVMKKYFAEP